MNTKNEKDIEKSSETLKILEKTTKEQCLAEQNLVSALVSFVNKGHKSLFNGIDWKTATSKEIGEIIAKGGDVNEYLETGGTPLYEAVGYENLEIVKYLLEKGAEPDKGYISSNIDGIGVIGGLEFEADDTPLINCCWSNDENMDINIKIMEELIKYGANVNYIPEHGYTAIMSACKGYDEDDAKIITPYLLDFLVKNGANITDYYDEIKEVYDCYKNNKVVSIEGLDIFERLLAKAKGKPDNTLEIRQEYDIMDECNGVIANFGERLLDKLKELTFLLKKEKITNIIYKDRYVHTPLTSSLFLHFILALKEKFPENFINPKIILETLSIEQQKYDNRWSFKDSFYSSKTRNNILTTAFENNNLSLEIKEVENLNKAEHRRFFAIETSAGNVIEITLDKGFSYWYYNRYKDYSSSYPFWEDVSEQAKALYESIIYIKNGQERSTRISISNHKKDSETTNNPLLQQKVWENMTLEYLKLQSEKGFDINEKDYKGWTPLMYAIIYSDSLASIKFLIENKADVNALTNLKENALTLACNYDVDIDKIKILIDNGIDINRIDNTGYTPLISTENPDIVKLLIENDANIHFLYRDLRTALFFAPNEQILKLFIDAGLDINAQDCLGYTLLMFVCLSWNNKEVDNNASVKIIKFLLDNGADVSLKNYNGKDAVSIIEEPKWNNKNLLDDGFPQELYQMMKDLRNAKTMQNEG